MNNPKKIMFAISDTGGGHRSAAAAIIAAMNPKQNVQCTIVDLLRATAFPGLKQAPEIYDYCSINHLWLNNLFFRKTNSIKRINALTRIIYFQCRQHLERQLATIQPDIVVAVHPLVIGLLHLIRKMSNATWPIITVVTDLVTIHASWATPGADLYLVPTQEAFHSLIKYGVPLNHIMYTGFPIHPKFTHHKLTQNQARKQLGIELDRFTVLLTGGGVGAGNMNEWVSTLEQECKDKQILVITGNNKQLYSELINRKNTSNRIHVYGFVNNMETMMSASDVIVSKAGPGTIMESITMKRPLIITEAVGIQETGNIDYVTKNRLGYYCPSPKVACKEINEIAKKNCDAHTLYDHLVTNGSMRITNIIHQQFEERSTPNPITERNHTIIRGA
ncbi:glycosyltransferase [Pelosinus sp. sgz500959]|uniref:MGDG synthase family glycosyltransferase n=1 Tax=Pelosinus sp. sgz500959 TaxID=3242472 RepID=UPI00366EAE68